MIHASRGIAARTSGGRTLSVESASGSSRSRNEIRLHLAAAGGLAALLLVVFGDVLFASETEIPSHAQGDGARYFLFMRLFGYSELRGGSIPLWNPHTFSGMPFVGNFQSAMYYPPNLIHLVTDLRLGLVLEFAIALFALGMLSFAWLRRKDLSGPACFIGAVTVVFASTVTLRVLAGQYTVLGTFAWWPLLLMSVDALERRASLGWTLAGIAAVTLMILAGHPPTVLQAALATSVYVLISLRASRRRVAWLASLAPIAIVPPLLAAVQLFEGLSTASEGLRRSGMSYAFAVSHSFPPEQLLTLLSPDLFGNADRFNLTYFGRVFYWDATFFVGIAGLLLAVHGASFGRPQQRTKALILAVFLTFVAMGGYTPVYRLLYHGLPGFDFVRAPSKFLFFAAVFVAWLVALGTERLVQSRAGLQRTAAVAGGLAAVAGGLALWAGLAPVSLTEGAGPMALFNALARSPDFTIDGQAADWHLRLLRGALVACATAVVAGALLLMARRRRWAAVALLVLAVVELTAFARIGRGRTRMTIELGLRPEVVETYAMAGVSRVHETAAPSNLAMSRRNFGIWGYDPVILGRYIEFMVWSQGLDWRDVKKPTFFVPYHSHPLHAMLRARYRLDWKTKERVVLDDPWPRFVFVDEFDVVATDAVLDRMSEPDFDPRRTVVLEEAPSPAPLVAPGSARRPRAELLGESSGHLDIEVELDRPQILLVTDAYSRGWRARPLEGSDQTAFEVLPGNYVLRAIPLEAGRHRLRLEYAPWAHRAGTWVSGVSGAGFAMACVAWVATTRRERARRRARATAPQG